MSQQSPTFSHMWICLISRKREPAAAKIRQRRAIYSPFVWPLLSSSVSSCFLTLLQEVYSFLAQELQTLASAHGERLLHTPHNPISLGKPSLSGCTQTMVPLTLVILWVCLSSSDVSGRPPGRERRGGDSAGLHAVHPPGVGGQVRKHGGGELRSCCQTERGTLAD